MKTNLFPAAAAGLPDHYNGRPQRLQRRFRRRLRQYAILAAAAPILAGCGAVNIPLPSLGASQAPEAQAQASSNVVVEASLPESLAYSDANSIARAAAEDLLGAVTSDTVDWENGETGSTGSVVSYPGEHAESGETCKSFGATVISFLGIHRYFGTACRRDRDVVVKSLQSAG